MTSRTDPTELVVLLLPNLDVAKGAAERLRVAVYEGRFGASDWVVAEHADGKVRLHHTKESGTARGFGEGALLGGLAGILIGSVLAPALVAGAVGAAVASLHRGGIPEDANRDRVRVIDAMGAAELTVARAMLDALGVAQDRRITALTKAVESLPAELRRPLA